MDLPLEHKKKILDLTKEWSKEEDPAIFEKIVFLLLPFIRGICTAYSVQKQNINDLVNESILILPPIFRKMGSIKSFDDYLFISIRHLIQDQELRSESRGVPLDIPFFDSGTLEEVDLLTFLLKENLLNVEDITLLRMKYIDRMSTTEILKTGKFGVRSTLLMRIKCVEDMVKYFNRRGL